MKVIKNVILIKIATIERCLDRIQEDYGSDFSTNFTKQDAVLLNLQRLIQASIDIAGAIVKHEGWGLPRNSRETFEILGQHNLLEEHLILELGKVVSFRNIAVHDYATLNLDIVESALNHKLGIFSDYKAICFEYLKKKS